MLLEWLCATSSTSQMSHLEGLMVTVGIKYWGFIIHVFTEYLLWATDSCSSLFDCHSVFQATCSSWFYHVFSTQRIIHQNARQLSLSDILHRFPSMQIALAAVKRQIVAWMHSGWKCCAHSVGLELWTPFWALPLCYLGLAFSWPPYPHL